MAFFNRLWSLVWLSSFTLSAQRELPSTWDMTSTTGNREKTERKKQWVGWDGQKTNKGGWTQWAQLASWLANWIFLSSPVVLQLCKPPPHGSLCVCAVWCTSYWRTLDPLHTHISTLSQFHTELKSFVVPWLPLEECKDTLSLILSHPGIVSHTLSLQQPTHVSHSLCQRCPLMLCLNDLYLVLFKGERWT